METDYEILRSAGHSAAKAQEIALNAKRGDPFSIYWIEKYKNEVTARDHALLGTDFKTETP
jgi:hypothetical protein